MNASMGRPVADLDDFLEVVPDVARAATPEPGPEPGRRGPRAGWWILAASAVLVAGSLAYWMLNTRSASATPPGPGVEETAPAMPAGVPGFAEMFVATYLTGTSNAIGEFLPGAPSVEAMTPAARYVTRTATMAAETVAADYWRIVVAADVLSLDDGSYRAAGIQHFQVGVMDDGGRLVAVALPARVAGPAPRPSPPRALQPADQTPTDEQGALVGDFLEALLTGRRDLERYLATGSPISPITPAPYEAIAVTALALYEDGSALATVDAQSSGGTIDTMQYVIRFSDEGPKPLVATLLAGPPSITRTDPGPP